MAYLELSGVRYCYPRHKKTVLHDIEFSLEKDEVIALTGSNGCGKTTLAKLILGILRPAKGQITLEGLPLSRYSLAGTGRRIGYVFQNPDQQFFCTTVFEEIGFGLTNLGYGPEAVREKADYYLDYFELSAYQDVYPLHLSQGEKKRLAIAAVLACETEFLILDEPTVGLDAYRKKLLLEYLHKIIALGRGMMLISHDTKFVEKVASRFVELENGRIQRDCRQ